MWGELGERGPRQMFTAATAACCDWFLSGREKIYQATSGCKDTRLASVSRDIGACLVSLLSAYQCGKVPDPPTKNIPGC